MRRTSLMLSLFAFVTAAALAALAATFAAQRIESASIQGVEHELVREGIDWATVDAHGLQVFLAGTAPDEAKRFQAVTAAGRAVDAARVIDQMNVADSEGLQPPRFSVELLRNDNGLQLIGLIPTASEPAALAARIQRQVGNSVPVANFLETADFPPPPLWTETLDFAVGVLKELPRSKISVKAGALQIKAMASSLGEQRRLEADLTRRTPDGVRVALALTAPRPVITPFSLRFVISQERVGFDACSASNEEARDRILQAAVKAGMEGKAECRIGLGVPTQTWPAAVETALAALAELGGESVTFSDADITLIARPGTSQAVFDRVIGTLENDLPEVFALTAVLPKEAVEGEVGPPEFVATLSPEGAVQLRGRVSGETARATAESYAMARFGTADVTMAARMDPELPASWGNRVLTGLEALSLLANGVVTITPDTVQINGQTGHQTARDDISGLLADKLGGGQEFEISVTYVERLDPTLSIPTPEECEKRLARIQVVQKLSFEPGSGDLDPTASTVLDEIADLLKLCGPIPLEIQGHTDSQGREIMNQELSQARAEAVLQAMRDRRILTASYTAVGYGESTPIADNQTEEGREANRRIEFHLIREGTPEDETALDTPAEDGQDADAGEEGNGDANE